MKKIKIGLIGLGNQGTIHAHIISELPYLEVSAVCDIDKAALDAWDCFRTTDYGELLVQDIDAVIISTPTYMHFPIAMDALHARKHILLEKPVTMCLEDTDKLIRAAAKSDNIVCVSFPIHFSHVLKTILALVHKSGKTKYLNFSEIRDNFRKPWYYDMHQSAGTIQEKMVHHFEIANSIFYPQQPKKIFAVGFKHVYGKNYKVTGITNEKYMVNADIIDTGSIIAEYQDKKLATFNLNMYQKPPICGTSLEIVSLKGNSIRALDMFNATNKIEYGSKRYILKNRKDIDSQGISHCGAVKELESFYKAVIHRKQPDSNLWVARQAQAVGQAAQDSISSGMPVDFSDYYSDEIKKIAKKMKWIRKPKRKMFRLEEYRSSPDATKKLSISELQEIINNNPIMSTAKIKLVFPWQTMFIDFSRQKVTSKRIKPNLVININQKAWSDFLDGKPLVKLYTSGNVKVSGDMNVIKNIRKEFITLLKLIKK